MEITVTITECYGNRTRHVSTHKTTERGEAIAIAVSRAYGKRASLHSDSGLSRPADGVWYGQIGKPMGRQGNLHNMITGRVRIDAE